MEQFFEAWVETVMRSVARQMGGTLKVGRRRETVSPLAWDPPYLGSQRSLVPDMILELEGTSFIIDAKYKRHWEEFQQGAWHEQNTALHERHREDLLQVLAYANLVSTADVVCCLVYPCSQGTWESLAKARPIIPSGRATKPRTPRSSLANGYSYGRAGKLCRGAVRQANPYRGIMIPVTPLTRR